jgi:hypothetical protein
MYIVYPSSSSLSFLVLVVIMSMENMTQGYITVEEEEEAVM